MVTEIMPPDLKDDARGTVPPPKPSIRVKSAYKVFRREDGTDVRAIDGVDLEVEQGEFVVLLGPSGCGKTTLLRGMAGLEELTDGYVEVQGRALFDSAKNINVVPEDRNIGMMFQSYALWPHMSVAANIAYPLVSQNVPKRDITRRVDDILATVGISELRGQYPSQISGGQQQRVALARALVSGHDVVLFDEPLSNVDAKVRDRLRVELLRLHAELGFTAVYVTHDQDEALALATTVIVLETGTVAQSASPQELYHRPQSAYVARFMGSANELRGTISESGSDGTTVIETAVGPVAGVSSRELEVGESATAFFRPEKCGHSNGPFDDGNQWQGVFERESFHGFYTDRSFDVNGTSITVRSFSTEKLVSAMQWLQIAPSDVQILSEESS